MAAPAPAVRPMREGDIPAVAEIHATCLDSPLARLGRPVLEALYRALLPDPASIGLILEGDGIAGYAFATADTASTDRAVRRSLRLAFRLVPALARRPLLALDFIRMSRAEARLRAAPPRLAAELVAIAVRPEKRRGGGGHALMGALRAEVRRRGLPGYALTTRREKAAYHLYRRHGLVETASLRVGGLEIVKMAEVFPPPGSG